MKKILFGVMLIFPSIALMCLGKFGNVTISSEKFEGILCAVLLLAGFLIGTWGLFEKDK